MLGLGNLSYRMSQDLDHFVEFEAMPDQQFNHFD